MNKTLVFLMLWLFFPATNAAPPTVWTQEPTSFLGVVLDRPMKDQTAIIKCKKTKAFCYSSSGYVSFDNFPDLGKWYYFDPLIEEGLFVGGWMSFKSYDLDYFLKLCIDKYGPPHTTSKTTYQNSMGAKFPGASYEWKGPRVYLLLSEYGDRVDIGRLYIASQKYIAKRDAAEKKAASSSVGKL